MKYAVLIADIVDSRKFENRLTVQILLKNAVNFLNRIFARELRSEVMISAGDSVQGMFYSFPACYLYYRWLALFLYPVKIRAGMSYGTIDYEKHWPTLELVGPVYYHARKALETCKEQNAHLLISTEEPEDIYVNMLIRLSANISKSYSITINLIQILSELLNPLDEKALIEPRKYGEELMNVMALKEDVYNFLHYLSAKFYSYQFQKINYDLLRRFAAERKNNILHSEQELILDSYWKKGYSTKIGEILGLPRQTIDRNYRYLNFVLLRNAEATILSYLKRYS
jgi:hypothetical protein